MTSSQPVTTPNALNFTPDNNNGYAYSGTVSATNVETTLLEFETNSEYLTGEFNFNKNTGDGDDINYQVYLNDQVIQGWMHDYSARGFRNLVKIIIPPFSKVKTTATNDTSSTGRAILCSFTSKAFGMTTTGYQ